MLTLKINNRIIDNWDNIQLSLDFNRIASQFSFTASPYNPENNLFKALKYPECTILYGNQTILTGTVIKPPKNKTVLGEKAKIQGYSTTGILTECTHNGKLQFEGLNLKQIAEKLTEPFGIKTIFSPTAQDVATQIFVSKTIRPEQTIASYLSPLGAQKGLIMRHNELSDLLFTNPDPKDKPIAFLTPTTPGVVSIDTDIDGSKLHSEITVIGQQDPLKEGQPAFTIKNTLLEGIYRPLTIIQTSGDDTDTEASARTALSKELEAIIVVIELGGLTVGTAGNERVPIPGDIIEVQAEGADIPERYRFMVLNNRIAYNAQTPKGKSVLRLVMHQTYTKTIPAPFWRV